MNQPNQIDQLVALIISHLPDSIGRRIQILEALLAVLPEDHPAQAEVATILIGLKTHDTLQREFKITV